MALFRTVAPLAEPVTVPECRAHLRIDHTSEDDLIAGLIRAAREEVESHAGLALIEQDWRLALDGWPRSGQVALPRHPVTEILSVTVYGEDGEAALVEPADYQLDTLSRPARLLVKSPEPPGLAMNGVEVDFRAGFGPAGTDVPDLLKRAMILLVAHWYEFRASFGPQDQPVSLPEGYQRLLAGYRSKRLL
ncbi:hypothetical protein FQ775_12420 [Nitratireductor mangrovi]|uniref:Phage gp6-like head-tail connector protein n=1 Tax=Nitratireductor mangrovi TaxID=2599600 RepID=A0A5B8KZC8_9HYPH|nr:head-tail connector protein [Nitratireductor mangrovi]QDZ01117.1 hypothetical protein FQ775_12420 [Nitratireductor mangrovi]